jgi:hypothetical protein
MARGSTCSKWTPLPADSHSAKCFGTPPIRPGWHSTLPARTCMQRMRRPTYQGTNSASVTAYGIERPSGSLKLLNTQSSQGARPCHLSVHPSGKYVLTANYARRNGGSACYPAERRIGSGDRGEKR